MRVNENTSTLVASRGLTLSTQAINRSLTRLSTGKRINSARDDVAGFSTIQNFDAQARGLRQANLNIGSALGLLQTADSAISVQVDIIHRLRDLAVQGANDTLTASDRTAISAEMTALMAEFQRITNETEFDGTKLLNGTFGSTSIQIGANSNSQLDVSISSLQASSIFEKSIGSGTFLSAATYATGSTPTDVVVGDIDGDGKADLVTVDDGDNTVSIRINQGDGTFGSRTTLSLGTATPDSVYLQDVSGDGILDVVVGDDGTTDVSVFTGNGDGTFNSQVTYNLSSSSGASLDFADFDGDGDLDIVAGNTSNQFSILYNNGDGTFQDAVTFATSSGADTDFVIAGDFDNDGNADIVAVDATDGSYELITGNGAGSFANQGVVVSGNGAASGLVKGDFDNDGILDFVVESNTNLYTALSDGAGTFTTTSFDSVDLTQIDVGDFNNDGQLDIIGLDANEYFIYTGDGAGNYTLASSGAISSTADGIGVADFNGDGVTDFVANSSGGSANVFIQGASVVSAASSINAATSADSQALIGILDNALDQLIEERTSLATSIISLESISQSNLLQSESIAEARSNIEDTDFALDTAELVRNQILQQAQISVLSQANVQKQALLGLIENL